MPDSRNSEMVERVSRALCSAAGLNPNNWSNPLKVAQARAAIEAMIDKRNAEFMVSLDGELLAETCGPYDGALSEAMHYAAQHRGRVDIEHVVRFALSPSLKEQEEGN